jgi:hypothetical protein
MPRKSPAARQAEVFSAAEWMALDEAFAAAESALRSIDLAEDDLAAHLRSGRLPSARWRRGDNTNTFERLPPAFWKELRLRKIDDGDIRVLRAREKDKWVRLNIVEQALDVESETAARVSVYFFVARAPLSRLYSTSAVLDPSGAAPETPGAGRRQSGRRAIKDWPTLLARELIRRGKAGENEPTALEMIEFCETTLDYSPSLREMQKRLKKLLG